MVFTVAYWRDMGYMVFPLSSSWIQLCEFGIVGPALSLLSLLSTTMLPVSFSSFLWLSKTCFGYISYLYILGFLCCWHIIDPIFFILGCQPNCQVLVTNILSNIDNTAPSSKSFLWFLKSKPKFNINKLNKSDVQLTFKLFMKFL